MKFMVTLQVDNESGTRAIHDNSLGTHIKTLMEDGRAECAYFGLKDGQRTGYMVLNIEDVSDLPHLLEPALQQLKANVEMTPVMTGEELERGLASV